MVQRYQSAVQDVQLIRQCRRKGMNAVMVGVREVEHDLHRLLSGLQSRMTAKRWFQIYVGV